MLKKLTITDPKAFKSSERTWYTYREAFLLEPKNTYLVMASICRFKGKIRFREVTIIIVFNVKVIHELLKNLVHICSF